MVHELILHPPKGSIPRPFDELQVLVRESETLAPYVNEEASTPEELVLVDLDTGAWARLAPIAPMEDEEEEPGTLLLQIPYLRPRFFGIEGALFTLALQQELGYLVEDPGDESSPGPRTRREEEIVASWDRHNRLALLEAEAAPGFQAHRIDPDLLSSVFSHNLHRRELRHKAGIAVEVPRLLLAALPARKDPAVVARYTAGQALWLPVTTTHLVLRRLRKGWLGWKEEEILIEATLLRERLAAFAIADVPAGLHGFTPGAGARDSLWNELAGSPARGLAWIDWNDILDAERSPR